MDQHQAEIFAAYLLTEGIASHLEQEGGLTQLWIKDEDQVNRALEELELFRRSPLDSKYQQATIRARTLQQKEKRKREKLSRNVVVFSDGSRQVNRPLTVALIVICGIVALLTDFGAEESWNKATTRALAFNAVSEPAASRVWLDNKENPDALQVRLASVLRGEFWRLVTPIFLHGDVFHLVFNMYFLFIFGSQIENRYGTFWFGMLVLLSAAVSNFVQCTVPAAVGGVEPFFFGPYMIAGLKGMSGVVYGLFGFILMKMSYEPSSGLYVPQSTVMLLLIWLVFCMTPIASEILKLNVANWAHVIGFLCGLVCGYGPFMLRRKSAEA